MNQTHRRRVNNNCNLLISIFMLKQRQSRTLNAELCHYGGLKVNDVQEKSLWVHCPICGGKTRVKVYADTVLVKFPLYCPKCKREIRIDVVQLKMVLSK